MTVTRVHKDPAALTMTFTAEFDHPLEAAWALCADPHKLEHWWGPPTHPATVTDHDLKSGGSAHRATQASRATRASRPDRAADQATAAVRFGSDPAAGRTTSAGRATFLVATGCSTASRTASRQNAMRCAGDRSP